MDQTLHSTHICRLSSLASFVLVFRTKCACAQMYIAPLPLKLATSLEAQVYNTDVGTESASYPLGKYTLCCICAEKTEQISSWILVLC